MNALQTRQNELENILRSATPLLMEGYTPRPGQDTQRRQKLGTQLKTSHTDLVTLYDSQVEKFLLEAFSKSFPGEKIIGEEETAQSQKHPREVAQNYDSFWVLDPIDGTTNYSRAYPFFCTTAAFLQKTKEGYEVLVGATWDPVRQEMFSASKGGGSWLNKERLKVSSVSNPKESLMSTGFACTRGYKETKSFNFFEDITKLTLGVRRDGSAALDLAYVATGRTDGYWEKGLSTWDVSAGILLVSEAGGKITHHDGQPIDPLSGEILCTNAFLHNWLQEQLNMV